MNEKEDEDNFCATQPLSLIPRDYLHVRPTQFPVTMSLEWTNNFFDARLAFSTFGTHPYRYNADSQHALLTFWGIVVNVNFSLIQNWISLRDLLKNLIFVLSKLLQLTKFTNSHLSTFNCYLFMEGICRAFLVIRKIRANLSNNPKIRINWVSKLIHKVFLWIILIWHHFAFPHSHEKHL